MDKLWYIQTTEYHFVLKRNELVTHEKSWRGTSSVVQWLRLHAPNAGGLGSNPSQETRSHILQLRVCRPQLRPSATLYIYKMKVYVTFSKGTIMETKRSMVVGGGQMNKWNTEDF